MENHSDEKLVAASHEGDKSAYASLVERYYKHIFLICLGIVGNVHDAEDAAQEVVLKGYQEISKLRGDSQFGAWIGKIAGNLCINFVRRKQRGRKILEEKIKLPEQKPNENDNLRRAIEKLPMEARLPLVMYYFDGQSVQKVAENLDMSTSAVYSKLRGAIKQLHGLLTVQGDENG
ncbi:MAG: sigma-70 family RNA polymerase sigma factor [Sedimentisphaerales bacterium]|nr:sigma-70 family RNA polymerase sigma factor [Sedimentisphaerales bacterium]